MFNNYGLVGMRRRSWVLGMNMCADTCGYGYKLKPYNSVARHDTIIHVASCGQPQTAEAGTQYTCADRYTE